MTRHDPYAQDYQQRYQPARYRQQQSPYPNPHPYTPAKQTNAMAVAAMVLGLLWAYWAGSVLALILGYLARGEIRRTGQGGDGMAVAAIVLGWAGLGILGLILVSGLF
jgi:hypothetical protein